jgi:hypothetical protein
VLVLVLVPVPVPVLVLVLVPVLVLVLMLSLRCRVAQETGEYGEAILLCVECFQGVDTLQHLSVSTLPLRALAS